MMKTLGRHHQRGGPEGHVRRRLRPPVGHRQAARAAHHRRAVPHHRHHAEAVPRGDQGIPDVLRRHRLERDAQHRAAARRVPPQRAGRCSIRMSRPRTRPPTAAAWRRRCRRSWSIAAKGYEFPAEIAPREGDVLHAEEASERLLRHAAREPPDRPRRRHAGGHRLHHQRLRARQRASTPSRTTSAPSCRTTPSTTAARRRTRSTCSTWRRSTPTSPPPPKSWKGCARSAARN